MIIKKKNVFVFDLDGTLIDSLEDVMRSLNKALELCGFKPLDNLSIKALVGPDLKEHLSLKVNDPRFDFDEFEKVFVDIYRDEKFFSTKLYPEVVETLEKLSSENKKIYVLTNKPSYQSIDLLRYFKIDHFFVEVIGPDTFNLAKPNPIGISKIQQREQCSLDDIVFIGDTEIDIQTAKNANITSIAVTYGYRDEFFLEEVGPNYMISCLSGLFKLQVLLN